MRLSYRGCRRRWNWAAREMYYPLVTPKPLEFGSAFHKAMEKFYDPLTWDDKEVAAALAQASFVQECKEQFSRYKRLNKGSIDPEMKKDYDERIQLGLGMIRHYTKFVSPVHDHNFKPVKVEIEFEVPIKSPSGEYLWCKCKQCQRRWKHHDAGSNDHDDWQERMRAELLREGKTDEEAVAYCVDEVNYWTQWVGLPVTYGGRIDMLAEDDLGRYWVFDWKELSLSMPLLTPRGWTTMGEIQVGDEVIGANGKATKVLGVSEVVEKEVWEIVFSDGTVIECSDQHLWKIHSTQFGWDRVLRTDQLTKFYEGYTIDPVCTPVQFDLKPDLPMRPYVLGSLIGDGHFGQNQISFASQSGETVELLRQYADAETLFQDERTHGGNQWRIRGPWKGQLQELGLWGHRSKTKFIPKDYLFASVEDRILLLQGLCDTDGSTGLYRFSTCSEQLAEDFNHLVRSLGGIASITTAKARKHCNGTTDNVEEYFVNYTLPEGIEPNQLERKRVGRPKRTKKTRHRIVEVRKTDRVESMKCIYVDSPEHLYVTKNFILTHNTAARMSGSAGTSDDFMLLDDQITSYCWALWSLGIKVEGFVYAEIKKAVPDEPEPNKTQRQGRWYSVNRQMTTTPEIYERTVAEGDPQGYAAGLYNDFIGYLKSPDGPKFHVRHQIFRSETELNNAGINIWNEASEMTDPNLRIYPSPGRFACSFCAYKEPCLSKNKGEDYEYTLNTLFEKRTKAYWEDRAPSTDGKGGS